MEGLWLRRCVLAAEEYLDTALGASSADGATEAGRARRVLTPAQQLYLACECVCVWPLGRQAGRHLARCSAWAVFGGAGGERASGLWCPCLLADINMNRP